MINKCRTATHCWLGQFFLENQARAAYTDRSFNTRIQETAILGNKGQGLLVAVFRDDLGQAPELLAFPAAGAGRRIGQIVWNGQAFQSRSA